LVGKKLKVYCLAFDRDDEDIKQILARIWKRRLNKPEVDGIHGTLFYELTEKKQLYPNKKESDLTIGLGRAQN
jgi:hypothetical protein